MPADSSKTKRILVVGGTGKTGLLVVNELLSLEESCKLDLDITVAYRTESKFDKLFDGQRHVVNGLKLDLSNFETYPTSLSQYDIIILTHGSEQFITPFRFIRMLFYQFWSQHPYYIEYQSIVRFVDVAKKTNPTIKFICMLLLSVYTIDYKC